MPASAQLRVSKISRVTSLTEPAPHVPCWSRWSRWSLTASNLSQPPCLPPYPHQPPLFCLPGNSSHESDVTTGKCLVRPGETPFVKCRSCLFVWPMNSPQIFHYPPFFLFFIMFFFHPKSMFISPGLLSGALLKLICLCLFFLKSHRLCEQSRNVSRPVLVFPSSSVGWGTEACWGKHQSCLVSKPLLRGLAKL